MRANIQCFSSWTRITSINIVFPSSTHLPTNCVISFFFTSELYFIVYMYSIFIIPSAVKGYLEYSHFLVIVNRVIKNIVKQVSVEQDGSHLGICQEVV